jgi:Ankyrin repeats (many copies)
MARLSVVAVHGPTAGANGRRRGRFVTRPRPCWHRRRNGRSREESGMQTDTNKGAELFTAVLAGDVERLRRLLPPCCDRAEDDAFTTPRGVTLLMAAAGSGREAVVELLLGRGADPSRRDARGRTAAFYAREAGHPHLAERLDTVVDKNATIR